MIFFNCYIFPWPKKDVYQKVKIKMNLSKLRALLFCIAHFRLHVQGGSKLMRPNLIWESASCNSLKQFKFFYFSRFKTLLFCWPHFLLRYFGLVSSEYPTGFEIFLIGTFTEYRMNEEMWRILMRFAKRK